MRWMQNKMILVPLLVLLFLLLTAFLGPLFFDHDYATQIRGAENLPCSWEYPFGTDTLGRDLLVRTLYGMRVSLTVGIGASVIVLVIGSIYGAVSGWFGGRVDDLMMRLLELVYSIPDMLVVLLLGTVLNVPLNAWVDASNSPLADRLATLGPGLIALFIAFGLLYWVGLARIVRGQVLQLKEQEFIIASKALGASGGRILFRHLLPNCTGPIIAATCMMIPSAIFLESFLSFLGLGVSAPMTSLGSLASDALGGLYSYPHRLLIPSTILSVMILAFNLLGDGLRDLLDPKIVRKGGQRT